MNNSINMLSPFVLYCQKVIPLAFDESMSYYECLCALYSYLKDTVVPAVNNNAEALEEVQKAMIELKDYVDHYFDNLDIQTEIDNKLDEMADSGELASIIAQYLDAQFIYGFDTIADLKAAETLASGNICRILGKTSYATGDGAFYRVRSLTVYDVIDDDEIVGLTNYPSLVAEKITDYAINHVESEITALDTRIDALEKGKKYLFIGDSYGTGWSPDGVTDSWIDVAVSILGLTSSQYVSHAKGGVAMDSANFAGNTFAAYVNDPEFVADNDITDIVVGGGYNDSNNSATQATIRQGLINLINACATKYPNGKLHVAFIGNTSVYADKWKLINKSAYYSLACEEFGIDFIPNAPFALHDYNTVFSSDGIHPNLAGEQAIGYVIGTYLKSGNADVVLPAKELNPNYPGIYSRVYNNVTTVGFSGGIWSRGVTNQNYTCNGQTPIKLMDVTQGYVIGTTQRTIRIPATTIIISSNKFYVCNGEIAIENGEMNYYPLRIRSDNADYETLNISGIQVFAFNKSFNTLEC